MSLLYAILISCLLFWNGCSKSTVETSPEAPSIYLGIRENDMPFIEKDSQFARESSFLGKISSPQGSQGKIIFSKLSGPEVVKLDLVIKDSSEEVYTVKGTYSAKEAFVLVLGGTNEDEKKDSELPFPQEPEKSASPASCSTPSINSPFPVPEPRFQPAAVCHL